MAYTEIKYEVEDGIATLTMHRPDKMNAFTGTMMAEMIDAFDRANKDDAVRVVIVTGSGDRAFCAGADLSQGAKTFDYENRDDRPQNAGAASASGEIDWSSEAVRDGGGRLTLKIFEIGTAVLERFELWREASSIIKQIAHEMRETVHLASLEGTNLVYIAKIESMQSLRVSMQSMIGERVRMYCTGLGKTLLAYLSPARVTEILADEEMIKFTEHTITSPLSSSATFTEP